MCVGGCETWTLLLKWERRLRLFANRELRTRFGSIRYEVTGVRRRLYNEEMYGLYFSVNIVRVIKKKKKERRMGWAVVVAYIVTGEVHTGFWWGELRERDHLQDLDIDGRIILQERQCTYKRDIEVF